MKFSAVNILFIFLACCSALAEPADGQGKPPHRKLKFDHFKSLKKIPEPSDVVYDAASNHLFIVSDHGILFECDTTGKVIRKAQKEGLDFEGVEVTDSFVYVSDETPRKVYQFRKDDLSLVTIIPVSWQGALNKAFESICYNYSKKCFIMVSEQPAVIIECDAAFRETKRYPFHAARDINAARWYKGEMYLMSSKDACIFRCDPNTYEIKEKYNINVFNAEGLGFGADGNVYITSDDLQRIYFFNKIPITP